MGPFYIDQSSSADLFQHFALLLNYCIFLFDFLIREEYDIFHNSWWTDYLNALTGLCIASFAFAAGISVGNATSATIRLLYDGYYDPDDDTKTDVNGKYLQSIWIATFISIIGWTCLVVYLTKFVKAAREARRQALAAIEADSLANSEDLVKQFETSTTFIESNKKYD